MSMVDVMSIFFLVVGSIAIINSFWLVAVSLFPFIVEQAAPRYSQPLRTTLLGVVLAIPFAIGVFFLRKFDNQVTQVLALVCVAVPVLLGLVGSAGFATRIGAGLRSAGDAAQPWRKTLRGGLVFTFTMLMPFVGWLVLFPWALISGLGAASAAINHRRVYGTGRPRRVERGGGHRSGEQRSGGQRSGEQRSDWQDRRPRRRRPPRSPKPTEPSS